MYFILCGVICLLSGLFGIASYSNANNSNNKIASFFVSNSSKGQYTFHLVCGIIIMGMLICGNILETKQSSNIVVETITSNQSEIKAPNTSESEKINGNIEKKVETHTCNICNRTFTGNGYCEASDGVWRTCEYPYSSNICSSICGMKSTNNLEKAADNLINATNTRLCDNCNIGHYQNGFCNLCGAASPEKVKQVRSKMPKCFLCKGTGIEKPMGSTMGDETGRICPACNGTGYTSY